MHRLAACIALTVIAAPCAAETPRDLLTRASFTQRDKAGALALVDAALAAARNDPKNPDAPLITAIGMGYHAKLTGSRSEAIAARVAYEGLIARDPGNAEAQLALGAWHLGAVYKLGGFVARAALGAKTAPGEAALERAVALGGGRAMFAGLAGLLRLQADSADARGRALAEHAARGTTPTLNDRYMQRSCAAVLAAIRNGMTGKPLQTLIDRSMPLGQIPGMA